MIIKDDPNCSDDSSTVLVDGKMYEENGSKRAPMSSGRPPRGKGVNISGPETIHFGDTYVSYGVINVPSDSFSSRPKARSKTLSEYLDLNDDITAQYRKPPSVTVNRRPINITISSRRVEYEKEEQKKKKKEELGLYLIAFYMLLIVLIFVLLVFLLFRDSFVKKSANDSPKNRPEIGGDPINRIEVPYTERIFGLRNGKCEPLTSADNNYRLKRKLRLSIRKSLLFTCTYTKPKACFAELQDEYNLHKDNDFADIYYNFIINSDGDMYEGRSIDSCPFTEKFLPDHSDVVTVGIGYCFNDGNAREYKKSDKEFDAIKKLIEYLTRTEKLDPDFKIELLDECRNSNLHERLKSSGIKFYDSSFYRMNSTSVAKNVSDSIYLGDTLAHKYRNNNPISVRINDHGGEENVPGSTFNTDCRSFFETDDWNKLKTIYKPRYVTFSNGSYCETGEYVSEKPINILMLKDSGDETKAQWNNWKDFLNSIFKMSRAIGSSRGVFTSSHLCHSEDSSYFDLFVPFLALVFNADENINGHQTDCITKHVRRAPFPRYPGFDFYDRRFNGYHDYFGGMMHYGGRFH